MTTIVPTIRSAGSAALLVVLAAGPGAAQGPLPPLTDAEVQQVRTAFEAMKQDPRGPYQRLRWFCADSTVHPPAGTPCRDRGGGVQYAELSPEAQRLAGLGIHVGTILQAISFEEFFDAEAAHHRLKELVLEDYLVGVDDGWVLRRARYYRGARQIEDEEARGHAFLERLLGMPAWTAANYLLAVQLVATVPHGSIGGDQLTQRIRNLATEIAGIDPGFMNLRVKIHSFPSRDDVAAVEAYRQRRGHAADVQSRLTELGTLLRQQYDGRRAAEQLGRYQRRLRSVLGDDLVAAQRALERDDATAGLRALAHLAPRIRQLVTTRADGRTNLVLLDLNGLIQEQAFVLAQRLAADSAPRPRADRLRGLAPHLALAVGAGLLSERERAAIEAETARLLGTERLTALAYKERLGYLARSLDWAAATVRSAFSPTYQRWTQVEPRTAGYLDAVIRGSILLPLSHELGRLAADADALLGTSHTILGTSVSQGVRGLNPGVAQRPLELIAPDDLHPQFEIGKIYLLPETGAELKPVAGVLTLDEGNLLSHVQLLARNLGIPNASLRPGMLELLRPALGHEVFFAVSPLGRVVLQRPADLSAAERALLAAGRDLRAERVRLDLSRLVLERWEPVPLDRLGMRESGVVAGPKAANLGELAKTFPGRVSAGVVLPFGMFYRHANRPFEGERTVLEQLADAYAEAARRRAAGQPDAEVDRFMFDALARVRRAILELPWQPEVRESILRAVREGFGDRLGRGVFVRSDTNVEDLPQFSGAGLNLTVPNRRTEAEILLAVRQVWTSPFSERAYLWRRQILDEDSRVYPSVLLLESVPSEKSGVLITTGLPAGEPGDITIATGEGVGGGVEGEETETIIVHADGAVRLLSQAKAPFRRVLVTEGAGGVRWLPARRPEVLLLPEELAQLREVVDRWSRLHGGGADGPVWDFEFGFVGGRLWLFQVRPFVRFRSSALLEQLRVLDAGVRERAERPVDLGVAR